ncbi:MAG: hypothetical protein WA962_15650, partial [Ornithinimicrobium sp.]
EPTVTPTPVSPSAAGRRVLLDALREDREVNGGWMKPGFHAIAVARLGAWSKSTDAPGWAARPAQAIFCRIGFIAVRGMYGIELPHTVTLGRRVRIAHQSGIVVHPFTVIGDDCTLRQGVSLGAGAGTDPQLFIKQAPRLGKGVSLGAGAVVVGRVNLGDGVSVGPNATVMTHVPAGATVLAQPPRIIRRPAPADAEPPT